MRLFGLLLLEIGNKEVRASCIHITHLVYFSMIHLSIKRLFKRLWRVEMRWRQWAMRSLSMPRRLWDVTAYIDLVDVCSATTQLDIHVIT
jgi:hypothetical protein